MSANAPIGEDPPQKWLHPNELLKLQRLKLRKSKLQARINQTQNSEKRVLSETQNNDQSNKRKNPFLKATESKRSKPDHSFLNEESSDQTLFKLLHLNSSAKEKPADQTNSFSNLLEKIHDSEKGEAVVVEAGKTWIPIDWSLKSKLRLMSSKPFVWNQKLKISEEASGITGFVRCLDKDSETTLDGSPNAKFHQCCLYWQQPVLPWLNLFPRLSGKVSEMGSSMASNAKIRESLHNAWADSLRSLFQLVRTCQCPYFYVCANNFTILFRASGINGFTEINASVIPTTRGFRQLLKQEDIEFTMPLKSKRASMDLGDETLDAPQEDVPKDEEDEDANQEKWLQSMGIDEKDIKQINYTQSKMVHKSECEIDNSEQSLVLIEGTEVHGFYNFLMNCKSITNITGPLAGIPPTLLSPVAYHGATLSALKVRQSKVRVDDSEYYSLELVGPILPQVCHSLFSIHPPEQNLTMTFANVKSSLPLSKVFSSKKNQDESGTMIFGKENLTDCGLSSKLLKYFCTSKAEQVTNVECVKYNNETNTYNWS